MHENCNPDNCPVNARVDRIEREFDRCLLNDTVHDSGALPEAWEIVPDSDVNKED